MLEGSDQVRVASSLCANRGFTTMTGKHHGVGWQGHQLRFDPFDQEGVIATGNVGATNRATKERIAGDHIPMARVERQMSGRVTRCEQAIKPEFAKHNFSRREQVFWWCGLRDAQAPFDSNCGHVRVLLERVRMNPDWNFEGFTNRLHRANVIKMRVRQDNRARFAIARLDHAEDLTGIIARIDQNARAGSRADQITRVDRFSDATRSSLQTRIPSRPSSAIRLAWLLARQFDLHRLIQFCERFAVLGLVKSASNDD
jgi:hypothetical protein